MPELPEVETVRRGLAKNLVDFRIDKLQVCRERSIASTGGAEVFIKEMKGVQVGEWSRRGKYLFAGLKKSKVSSASQKDLINAGWWVIHLRMTGHFQWLQKEISPCTHTRVRFWNKKGIELRFVDVRSFGQMWWVPPTTHPAKIIPGIQKLGPEPFSKEFNSKYLEQSLKGRTRSIKSSLLDQSIVAGAGNIYADETLFQAGILPYKVSNKLTNEERKKLCQKLREVLLSSIKEGGTTFSDFRDLEGLNGNYGDQAWVYRRTNQPCRKCGSIIKRQVIAGRGTHWCPLCQN